MSIPSPTRGILIRMLWFGRLVGTAIVPSGSAFIASIEGKEYVVTAYHVAKLCRFKPYIRHHGRWNAYEWEVLVRDKENDVAVLQMSSPTGVSFSYVEYGIVEGAIHGQLGYALGFPTVIENQKLLTNHVLEINGRPIAIPTLLVVNLTQGTDIMYSSSYINDGYSGGAVVYPILGEDKWGVAGIITHFPYYPRRVYDTNFKETDQYVLQHAGLVGYRSWNLIAHLIDVARES